MLKKYLARVKQGRYNEISVLSLTKIISNSKK